MCTYVYLGIICICTLYPRGIVHCTRDRIRAVVGCAMDKDAFALLSIICIFMEMGYLTDYDKNVLKQYNLFRTAFRTTTQGVCISYYA